MRRFKVVLIFLIMCVVSHFAALPVQDKRALREREINDRGCLIAPRPINNLNQQETALFNQLRVRPISGVTQTLEDDVHIHRVAPCVTEAPAPVV